MIVPFLKLDQQYESIKEDVDLAVGQVLSQGAFSQKPFVDQFEHAFAAAYGVHHCAGVASGTAAIQLVLQALEIGSGDRVIVPTHTCFATAEAVCNAGATPVFVDCMEATFNMNPAEIGQVIDPQTKAIIAVHLYGQAADMAGIKSIADQYNLVLIEDCAQAQFSKFRGQLAGTFGHAGCFSFYPTKNLGGYGEAGAVITNDGSLHTRISQLRNHGATSKDHHQLIGNNFRMDGLQAAVIQTKLKYINTWTDKRRENAAAYRTGLRSVAEIKLPQELKDSYHSYHQFVIRTPRRDELQAYLQAQGITTLIHYPIPSHLQGAFAHLDHKEGSFPVAERIASEILSLPISDQHPGVEIDYVCMKIKQFFK